MCSETDIPETQLDGIIFAEGIPFYAMLYVDRLSAQLFVLLLMETDNFWPKTLGPESGQLFIHGKIQ